MSKNQNKKSTETMIEELAIMVGRGFADCATKTDVEKLTVKVEEGFTAADQRLERIEFSTSGLSRRIDTLEDRVRQLAVKTKITFT